MDKQLIFDYIDQRAAVFTNISDRIWEFAELSMEEHRSAACYVDFLQREGFTVVENVVGIPTAFTASFGSGKPVIGILAEYDALSSLSQKSGCTTAEPLVPGGSGHGCGHNLLGAGSLAAVVAIKHMIEEGRLSGTVVFYGCPGEEGCAGKAFMARDGMFRDLDAALTWHPSDVNEVRTGSNAACLQIEYTFTGIAAHAAGCPEMGRSALDAAELMNVGVQFLREHIKRTDSVHYSFLDTGGPSPNVVQPVARVLYMVRSDSVRNAKKVLERVNNIARGAALTFCVLLNIDKIIYLMNNFMLKKNSASDIMISKQKIVGVCCGFYGKELKGHVIPMVDLRAKPYNLNDADIAWVENTIASMTAEEKVGQLFWQLCLSDSDEYLSDLMGKYHLGGCRYNGMVGQKVLNQNRAIQKHSKIPAFIACNPEKGGDGVCNDGTTVGFGVKVGATGNVEYARAMGKVSGAQIKATGCNMAFSPVVDICYNWECEEVLLRSFGNDHERVATMSKAYMDGLHETDGVFCCAKHFPGNGQDYRDAHLSNNVNHFTHDKWMETYGHVYKTLIDGGLDAIMGGHILMPEYMAEINPDITADTIMPGTLCKEIMTDLLRGELGFNGMVVTDASHMVGMTNRMKRADMLPAAINAGCDMFLFFNDPDEDFATMLNAYNTGIISEERMTEALTRILGLKAAKGMHKKSVEELCGTDEELAAALNNEEFKSYAPAITRDALTLVKYKDEGVLPLSPDKTKRIMIVNIKGAETSMGKLMAMMGGGNKKSPAERFCEKLQAKGFDAFLYESPIDKVMKEVQQGKPFSLNLYFAGKNAIADFTSGMDLVVSFFDVAGGHPTFGMSKGGGEIPWYVHEVPVVGISVNKPTMLADAPMLRTYINTYDSSDDALDALVDALLAGPEAFKGTDPIDSYCGMFDTHM